MDEHILSGIILEEVRAIWMWRFCIILIILFFCDTLSSGEVIPRRIRYGWRDYL
jgi:hypothetical protein